MRLLFATQGASLGMFSALAERLKERESVEAVGFTVADSQHYRDWLARNPDFEARGYVLLKEWEVTRDLAGRPDLDVLARYETQIGGVAGLFGAIVTDRRLLLGPNCTLRQDYRRRFSDEQMGVLLQRGAMAVERLFDAVQPTAVAGFICVSLLEYLVYLTARARRVPYLNLRTTRIGNRFCYGSTLNDPSPELVVAYAAARATAQPHMQDAKEHVELVRNKNAKYEGSLHATATPVQTVAPSGGPIWGALRFARTWISYYRSESRFDNHVMDPARALLLKGLLNPLRARRVDRALRPDYVTPAQLKSRRFAFFPLHTEPEIALLVYGRPLMNQIEAIRWLALSLPADMVLVVKEHPWMIGKRPLSAYREMLNIPRVLLGAPEIDTLKWISAADLVTVHTSSVGLEGAILKKPVLSLGHCPFNLLPSSMVRRCVDLTQLPGEIRDLLQSHAHDEQALLAYVRALLAVSVDINLYSNLLGRRWTIASVKREFHDDIERLAEYTRKWLAVPPPVETADASGAAPW